MIGVDIILFAQSKEKENDYDDGDDHDHEDHDFDDHGDRDDYDQFDIFLWDSRTLPREQAQLYGVTVINRPKKRICAHCLFSYTMKTAHVKVIKYNRVHVLRWLGLDLSHESLFSFHSSNVTPQYPMTTGCLKKIIRRLIKH